MQNVELEIVEMMSCIDIEGAVCLLSVLVKHSSGI